MINYTNVSHVLTYQLKRVAYTDMPDQQTDKSKSQVGFVSQVASARDALAGDSGVYGLVIVAPIFAVVGAVIGKNVLGCSGGIVLLIVLIAIFAPLILLTSKSFVDARRAHDVYIEKKRQAAAHLQAGGQSEEDV